MGLGSSLGAALEGWEKSAQSRRNDEKVEIAREEGRQRKEYQGKQMEVMDYNLKSAKAADDAANTPEALALKALKIKNATAKIKTEMAYRKDLFGTDAQKTQQLEQDTAEIKRTVEDKIEIDHAVETHGNVLEEIGAGGKLSRNTLNSVNTLIKGPGFKTKFPNPLGFFNPNDETHVASMKDSAKKALALQGIDLKKIEPEKAKEILEDMEDYLVESGKKGLILADTVTGEMHPIQNIFGITNTKDRQPTNRIKKAEEATSRIAQGVVAKNSRKRAMGLNDVPVWQEGDGTAKSKENKGKLLYKGKNASKETERREYFKLPIPEELKSINKHNDSLINPKGKKGDVATGFWAGATPEQVEESISNQMMALAELEIGDEEVDNILARTRAGINLIKDEGTRKKMRATLKRGEQLMVGKEFVFKGSISDGEQNKIDLIENNNVSDSAGLKKDKEKVLAEVTLVDGLDDIMEDIVEIEEGEGMVNEAMASEMFMKALGIAPDKATSLLATLKGTDREAMRKQINNTISVSSKLGKILATYVKNTSGAAVSDDERDFLSGVIMGARGADSTSIVRSMTSFREATTDTELGARLRDMTLIAGIPATMRRVNTMVKSPIDFQSRVDTAKKAKGAKKPAPEAPAAEVEMSDNTKNALRSL